MITVQELIAILQTLPADLPVILQKDPEGNGYHKAAGAAIVIPESFDYYIDMVYTPEWSYSDADFESQEDWDEFKQTAPKAVVIYP